MNGVALDEDIHQLLVSCDSSPSLVEGGKVVVSAKMALNIPTKPVTSFVTKGAQKKWGLLEYWGLFLSGTWAVNTGSRTVSSAEIGFYLAFTFV